MRFSSLALIVLLTVVVSPAVGADQITVDRAVPCTGIDQMEPVGVADSFPADVGSLTFFTQLSGGAAGDTVIHVWYREGKETARVELAVRGETWRTWSRKTIPSSWAGAWRVVVVDPAGTELAAADFTVGS